MSLVLKGLMMFLFLYTDLLWNVAGESSEVHQTNRTKGDSAGPICGEPRSRRRRQTRLP